MSIDDEFACPPTPAENAWGYRNIGFQVVPARLPSNPNKEGQWKCPIIKWRHLEHTRMPDEDFAGLYGPRGSFVNHPSMGIVCGECSDRVFIVDLDTYKNASAAAWWEETVSGHMEPETVEQVTGGGGVQKLFRAPEDWTPPTNKTTKGVDIRGQGGFAMLPPSLHDSGKTYKWREGCSPKERAIAIAEPWLCEAIDRLVRDFGGKTAGNGTLNSGELNGPSGRKLNSERSGNEQTKDAFGKHTDLREQKMTDMTYAAAITWQRERMAAGAFPYPSEQEILEKGEEKYLVYETWAGRKPDENQSAPLADVLEAAGRGRTAFMERWRRVTAPAKWDHEILVKAREPAPRNNNLRRELPGPVNQPISEPPASPLLPLPWADMSNWDHEPVPVRKWAIRDRVPLNQVGLFSGEGGTGKSIMELMKDVAHCCDGVDWFGSLPEQGGAFYLGAEDELDEIHIRLADIIKAHPGLKFADLIKGGLKILPLLGEDSMLCVLSGRGGNTVETTQLYRRLLEAAGDLKPKNISIDTLSRAFGGDEINRVQVYAFAMHMQALAQVAHGSVTVLSHPSLTGIATGTGLSGSTAWHGAFRFRQYFKGIKEEDDDPDTRDTRILEFKKNQYGPRGAPVLVRYADGVFRPVNGATDPERAAREAKADGMFITLLRRVNARDDRVTHVVNSPSYYAPKVFAGEPEAREGKFRAGELEEAMKRLMALGRVLSVPHRENGKTQKRLVLCPGT